MSSQTSGRMNSSEGIGIELIIEKATEKDLPNICEIDVAGFPTRWHEKTYRDQLSNEIAIFLIARTDDQTVGFALSWAAAGELHILKVAAKEGFRKLGVGTRLMKETFALAIDRGCDRSYLEVRPSNFAAQKMYKNLGFELLGIRKGYYTDTNEDALVLGADLVSSEKEMD